MGKSIEAEAAEQLAAQTPAPDAGAEGKEK